MSNNNLTMAVIAVAIMAVIGWYTPFGGTTFSGVTNYDALETESLAVGSGCDNEGDTCTGTSLTFVKAGTCNATIDSLPVVASSTAVAYCTGITNITASDKVLVALPTDEGGTFGGFGVSFTDATSTTGFEFGLQNFTGAATSSFIKATSSVQYWIFR